MRRVFEVLLKVDESASGLDQSLEEIRVARFGFEPKLLEDIVRVIITLFVPAMEKRAVKRMFCDIRLTRIDIVVSQLSHQLRNPLAFAHGKLNLLLVSCDPVWLANRRYTTLAQRMSKPPTISSSADTLIRLLFLPGSRRSLRRATPCQRK